jgi:hypothetical protein
MADMDTANKGTGQRTLIAPVETIIPQSNFWDKYMMTGTRELLPSRYVEWDYFVKGSPTAHFVGEGVTVPPTERSIFETAQIECPLYQYRKVIGLKDLASRMPGEPYGSMPPGMFKTIQERAGKLEADDDIECVNAVAALRTKIVCNFLFQGLVEVRGYGVNRKINYNLPNRITLTGSDRWGQPGVDPIRDMREWCEILEDYGFNPIAVIMSRKPWDVVENNTKWMSQLDNARTEKGLFAPEKAADYGNAAFMATMRDPFVDVYTQRSTYWDDILKKRVSHLPENTLIIVTEESKRNRFVYGSIDYMENGQYRSVSGEFIKEVWHDDRAGTREVVVTSRAVPIPGNVHSWLVATVM